MVSKAMHTSVYKIFTESEWKFFQETGQFEGSPDDLRDGFIHLCTSEQVAGVIERFFAGQHPLYVAEFSSPGFTQQLTWEASALGEIYPHLYQRELLTVHVSDLNILKK
jgi:uncharacterized protein (DUF952 family)